MTTSTGAPVSSTTPPAVGDVLFTTDNLYRGTARHHARLWTSTASLACTFVSVSGNTASAACDGVGAIGGSQVVSLSTQTFSGTSGPTLFPITGGTGLFLHAKGTVRVVPIGKANNDEFTITIR